TLDIKCQYSENLFHHISKFPEDMQLKEDTVNVHYAILQFHIEAHGSKCEENFCFRYMRHMAMVCGEIVESGWVYTNLLLMSVREMGSVCHKTLNNHWGTYNWQKVVSFGTSFLVSCQWLPLLTDVF
ncbi:hypothetical protein GLOTRDRAFT_44405, partial [Gloeophyllum trabeum ATCC 11539]